MQPSLLRNPCHKFSAFNVHNICSTSAWLVLTKSATVQPLDELLKKQDTERKKSLRELYKSDRFGEDWKKLVFTGYGNFSMCRVDKSTVTCDCQEFIERGSCFHSKYFGLIFRKKVPRKQDMPVCGPGVDWANIAETCLKRIICAYPKIYDSARDTKMLEASPPDTNPFRDLKRCIIDDNSLDDIGYTPIRTK